MDKFAEKLKMTLIYIAIAIGAIDVGLIIWAVSKMV